MTGQVWAYARVSTRDQNPQLQLDALEASGYDTLVQEKESAKRGVFRPAWQELLPLPQPGDTLKFWKSDRWGRSAADVLTTVGELRDRGVTVVSLTENFDLATKEGRLMFGVLALATEYELELRAERQADGIAAARRRQAEGRMLPGKKHIGRPAVTGPAELSATTGDGSRYCETRRDTRKGAAVARTIPMPSKEELPDGPRRAFVTELRRYYRVARPSLREISQAIERHTDPRLDKVTASAETVRRMITGKVLPGAGAPVRRLPRALRPGGGRSGRRALG
ncbi:MAG: recombinase family protein [Streptosporangiaceae bacterium]